MTRQKGGGVPVDLGLEDDVNYRGSLRKPKEGWLQKGDPKYGDALRLVVDLDIGRKDGRTVRDWMSQSVQAQPNGKPAKMRQLLNGLAERPAETELWWDAETLEWGYDMKPNSPAYAHLAEGMTVLFKGENRPNGKGQSSYRITGYKAVAKAKGVDVDGA